GEEEGVLQLLGFVGVVAAGLPDQLAAVQLVGLQPVVRHPLADFLIDAANIAGGAAPRVDLVEGRDGEVLDHVDADVIRGEAAGDRILQDDLGLDVAAALVHRHPVLDRTDVLRVAQHAVDAEGRRRLPVNIAGLEVLLVAELDAANDASVDAPETAIDHERDNLAVLALDRGGDGRKAVQVRQLSVGKDLKGLVDVFRFAAAFLGELLFPSRLQESSGADRLGGVAGVAERQRPVVALTI